MDWIHDEFNSPLDAEHRARSCIPGSLFRVDDARISGLIDLPKALMVKFFENYRAGVGLDWNPSVILKDLDDLSNLLPDLPIVTISC